MTFADGMLLACLVSTLFMTGLIWFVQVVHYPLFAQVGSESFVAYHAAHSSLTTLVVVAPMVIELTTSLGMTVLRPRGVGASLVGISLVLAVVSWASTGLIQVPCHHRLAAGYDEGIGGRLVATNWIRVGSWTGHAVVIILMITRRLSVS